MGTDHIYNIDTFNEMQPASSDPAYLASTSKAVYTGLRAADKRAVWLMQGWLFRNSRFWNRDTVHAYLSGVPNDGMIILDLYTEELPLWSKFDSYFGKRFIWCTLHNFGGRRAVYGNLTRIGTGPVVDRVTPNATMVGVGITMEAIEQNPVVYELTLEMAWRESVVDIDQWLAEYTTYRYGSSSKNSLLAWHTLKSAVYRFGFKEAFFGYLHKAPQIPTSTVQTLPELFVSISPGFEGQATQQCFTESEYNVTGVVEAWRYLVDASGD